MRIDLMTPAIVRRLGDRERGATLLVSIAILTLLFVFSLAFVRLVNFERVASTNYTDSVRARMLARAGIERAVVELQRLVQRRHYSHPGDPITGAATDPLLSAPLGDAWGYGEGDRPAPLQPQLDSPQRPTYNTVTHEFTFGGRQFPLDLHSTLRPSFRMMDPSGKTLYGAALMYSGLMGQSYAAGADIYKLKILDTTRMFDLNHPDPVAARRMLKNLLQATGVAAGNAKNLANAVMDRRLASGFRSKAEVEAILVNPPGMSGSGLTSAFYHRNVRDLITVYTWRDEKVIRPWAVNCVSTSTNPAVGSVSDDIGPQYLTGGPGPPIIPILTEVPQRQLAISAPRAPININTAPFPVLVAMFAEASALTERFGGFRITYSGAVTLANLIVTRRMSAAVGQGPFRTWNEFESFVDAQDFSSAANFPTYVITDKLDGPLTAAVTGLTGTIPHHARSEVPVNAASLARVALGGTLGAAPANNQGVKDLVKAVANPNTMVSKFGMLPNHGGGKLPAGARLPRFVDKSDIVALTTEGCLDAMGIFEITSIGLVLIPGVDPTDLKIVAAQTEQKVVKVYDVLRLTTQQEFEQNRAFMVGGDFIEALDNKRQPGTPPPLPAYNWPYTVHGTNQLAYQGYAHGWPGMVTWPTYSLDRQDRFDTAGNPLPAGQGYAAKYDGTGATANYIMASYDGHMTLTNLIAYVMQDNDFVIGFARGKLEAFKVRAWWDPCRQYHSGVGITDDSSVGAGFANVDNDGDGWVDELPSRPADASEVTALARPLNRISLQVRSKGNDNPSESQLVDEVVPTASPATANDLFVDGSSLWNTGVAIHPFRRYKASGDPDNNKSQFIAYDSGNLDLVRGFSLRFWVQPTVDPFLQPFEVLCSFVGSRGNHTGFSGIGVPSYTDRDPATNGGDARHVGWRIFKQATAAQVYITLEAVGTGTALGPWATTGGGASSVSIPVTPKATTVTTNPIRPEWLPGSWHWVVLNLGPRAEVAQAGIYDASLQVDMAQMNLASSLRMHGVNFNDTLGELHGYLPGSTGLPYDRGPLDSGSTGCQFFRTPHQLGNWYNCEANGAFSQSTDDAPIGPGNQGDQYGPDAVVLNGGGTNYRAGPSWQSNPFPAGSYNHEIWLDFRKAPGDTSTGTPPSDAQMSQNPGPGGFNGWTHTMAGGEMGNDSVPGGHEWEIWQIVKYTVSSTSGTACACCVGTLAPPGDPGYAGVDPRNDLLPLYVSTASCNHDSIGTAKSGYGPIMGSTYWCLIYSKSYIITGSGLSSAPTMDYQCDDCHGCENCDIDGPIFFGGEPASSNYNAVSQGAAPQGYNMANMAHATFDNFVFQNNKERRTDNGDDVNRDFYEDRFYETSLAYMMGGMAGGISKNFGAQYHRGLLELIGRRVRLGTITWTGYPSLEGQRFEVGLYSVPAFDAPLPGGNSNFNLGNSAILTGALGTPTSTPAGPYAPDPATNPASGADQFSDSPIGGTAFTALPVVSDSAMPFNEKGLDLLGWQYDGEGTPSTSTGAVSPQLLILAVRLRETPPPTDLGNSSVAGAGTATGDPLAVGVGRTGTGGTRGVVGATLPQPLLSTPVFEDVTITLIPDRTTTLYAEEGVEE